MKFPRRFTSVVALVLAFNVAALPISAYAVNIATTPPAAPADQGPDAEACSDATATATQDQNATLWLLGGCLLSFWVVIAAQVIEPTPPATALLGKDEAYVAEYTDCYSRTAKKIRTKKSITGCLIGGVVVGLGYLVVGVLLATNDNLYYY